MNEFIRINVLPITTIVVLAISACDPQFKNPKTPPEFSDQNARMYQMVFDSSPDPAQNELQVRRFKGHLHLPDIEGIFGDLHSLPQADNCNVAGGPVIKDGLTWYLNVTPDLVGVNLVSVAPDGTISSAFDLDGDRLVDLLDIGQIDNQRFSIFSEELGLDVFKLWLQGQNPLCSNGLSQQLGLPDMGCESNDSNSSGGGGFAPGSGIVSPFDLLCSKYDTSPWAGVMDNVNRGQAGFGVYRTSILDDEVYRNESNPSTMRVVETYVTKNTNTGEIDHITKFITDYDTSTDPPRVVQTIEEQVDSNGNGTRTYQTYNADGTPTSFSTTETFNANVNEEKDNYNQESSIPPPDTPPAPPPSSGGSETDPGPEGDDSNVAAFCQRRANYQSGVEGAVSQDPSSMDVSCNDLVDAPSSRTCKVLEWSRPEDFREFLEPPSDEAGCDAFDDPDRTCEPDSVQDRVRRFLGRTAELWSLDTPDLNICPPFACDPANATELRSYTAGEVEFACSPIIEEPKLQPSVENCPPGTYYAPVTDRCIEIQIPLNKKNGEGGGGSAGGGCNLSVGACSSQGLSFDENSCSCVPIQ